MMCRLTTVRKGLMLGFRKCPLCDGDLFDGEAICAEHHEPEDHDD